MNTPDMARVYINADRLWKDLHDLSAIGREDSDVSRDDRQGIGQGISRLAFNPSDMEGRKWLLNRFRQAGLEARIDSAGNVIGRLNSQRGRRGGGGDDGSSTPTIIMGSHTDTVPSGGMFDGALGVLAGLECIRTIVESGTELLHPVEVVSFANEEGSRIGPGIFGSRAFFTGIPHDEWARVLPVLRQAGLGQGPSAEDPDAPPPPRVLSDYAGYLELHIEQGGVLDEAGEDIGVVQGIVCIHAFTAKFAGVANHAGTTPMENRKDALQGAARLILEIPQVVKGLGSGITVGTCGQVRVSPGGRNIIPGEAEISVEVRDLDDAVARRVVTALGQRAAAIAGNLGLQVQLSEVSETPAALLDERVQDAVEDSAREMGLKYRRMPSGAGHDCMIAAKLIPSGMVFVPSRGGISHSPKEWTDKEKCANGANVLLRTLLRLDALL